MTLKDRIAEYNGFKTWDEMITKATNLEIPFNVPVYLQSQYSSTFLLDLLVELKSKKFKVVVRDDKCYLVNTEKKKRKSKS